MNPHRLNQLYVILIIIFHNENVTIIFFDQCGKNEVNGARHWRILWHAVFREIIDTHHQLLNIDRARSSATISERKMFINVKI
jgi:hypothetical protein